MDEDGKMQKILHIVLLILRKPRIVKRGGLFGEH